jgi:hypothetical protein
MRLDMPGDRESTSNTLRKTNQKHGYSLACNGVKLKVVAAVGTRIEKACQAHHTLD